MNVQEFDTEFDVLYNNITSNQAPGLNSYEKSVFLTKAEKQLVTEYFNHVSDFGNGGFDGSEKRQVDFNSIIKLYVSHTPLPGTSILDPRSKVFPMPQNMMFALNEFVDIYTIDNKLSHTLKVTPLSYTEYQRLMSQPYKYPVKGEAWRLITNRRAEIICRCPDNCILMYRLRYVKTPDPIILEDLSSLGVSIDSMTSVSVGDLPEEMHHEILERAVTLAKIAWQGSTMTQAALAVEANRNKN